MRLLAAAAAVFVALTGLAAAQTYDTPQALLEAFYEPYFGGQFLDDDSRFRSQALQALYDQDAEITPAGEMGALSFDPHVDGQDFDLADFEIGAPGIAGEYASADVTFTNFGQPRSLTYEMVFEDGGWKIDDVVSTNPENAYRLSDIFAENAALYQ